MSVPLIVGDEAVTSELSVHPVLATGQLLPLFHTLLSTFFVFEKGCPRCTEACLQSSAEPHGRIRAVWAGRALLFAASPSQRRECACRNSSRDCLSSLYCRTSTPYLAIPVRPGSSVYRTKCTRALPPGALVAVDFYPVESSSSHTDTRPSTLFPFYWTCAGLRSGRASRLRPVRGPAIESCLLLARTTGERELKQARRGTWPSSLQHT